MGGQVRRGLCREWGSLWVGGGGGGWRGRERRDMDGQSSMCLSSSYALNLGLTWRAQGSRGRPREWSASGGGSPPPGSAPRPPGTAGWCAPPCAASSGSLPSGAGCERKVSHQRRRPQSDCSYKKVNMAMLRRGGFSPQVKTYSPHRPEGNLYSAVGYGNNCCCIALLLHTDNIIYSNRII